MKKGLLLIAALAATTGAYAQQEAGWLSPFNADAAAAWGFADNAWPKDKVSRPAGTLIAETENVVLRTAFEDNCAASGVSANGFSYYVVNGVSYKKTTNDEGITDNPMQGVVGNTNPAALSNVLDPSSITTSSGWVLDYEVKKDGWLTCFAKNSSNKNLYVIEGTKNSQGEISANGAVAYFFKMPATDKNNPGLTEISYQLPADADGYINADAPDIDKYIEGGVIAWPWNIQSNLSDTPLNAPALNDKGKENYPSGFGVTIFPVYADCHYYFFCTGSKITAGPFVWTAERPTQVAACNKTVNEDESVTYTTMDYVGTYDPSKEAGIDNIAADVKATEIDWNAPVYNVMGQKVSKNFKGIAIQNGAKFVVK